MKTDYKGWVKFVPLLILPTVLYWLLAAHMSWRPRTLRPAGYVIITDIKYSPDGRLLAVGVNTRAAKSSNRVKGAIQLWNPQTEKLQKVFQESDLNSKDSAFVNSVLFSSDGKQLISLTANDCGAALCNNVNVRSINTGKLHQTTLDVMVVFRLIALLPGNKALIGADGYYAHYKTARVWNLRMNQLAWEISLRGSLEPVAAYCPRRQIVAVGNDGKSLIGLRNPQTGALLRSFVKDNPIHIVTALAFSPDGNLLASECSDNTVRLWDVETGKLAYKLKKDNSIDYSAARIVFSPDGNLLATSYKWKTIQLWDVATGRLLRTLRGHSNGITALCFSPDGTSLASSSQDGTVKLWRIR